MTDRQASTPARWQLSWRADPVARKLADRHYNRQSVGAAQFVPPGACVVLRTPEGDAAWITSWPLAEYVQHEWAGAWVNSLFRNERPENLSSELIREAVAATLAVWPVPPALGMVTFVDAAKTRRKRDPGRCYRRAGFTHVGFTQGGLWAFQMLPDEMPEPLAALGTQEMFWRRDMGRADGTYDAEMWGAVTDFAEGAMQDAMVRHG